MRKKLVTAFPSKAGYPTDGMATVEEARKFLGVSDDTVYRMVSSKTIDHKMVRNLIRIPWPALHAYTAPSVTK